MKHLGHTARYLRELKGLSQREAAKHLGISPVHLCNIENERSSPSPELLERFRNLLGADLYVVAWCLYGDLDKLPAAVRKSARALAQSWQTEFDALRKKREGSRYHA